MILSLSLILLLGLLAGFLCKKLSLPPLIGMLAVGILIGPYALNLLDETIIAISGDLRVIALIVVLARVGLSLNIADLKSVGRPALLICFLPAIFEMAATIILAPILLGITYMQAALLAAVIAAVSPAVIVPKMLVVIEEGYGVKKSIPQLILAGASIDDVFVIIIFSTFLSLNETDTLNLAFLADIPISILFGIAVGFGIGFVLITIFSHFHIRDTAKIVIFFGASFFLVGIEDLIPIPFSALIAVIFIGISMQRVKKKVTDRLSIKCSKIWYGAEILLFVLVGATVNISYAQSAGIGIIILLIVVLLARSLGVLFSLLGSPLNAKERIFCVFAYLPKATVQAAIGSIPLSAGIAGGEIILTAAVISIILTAPLGAILIDKNYKKLLRK